MIKIIRQTIYLLILHWSNFNSPLTAASRFALISPVEKSPRVWALQLAAEDRRIGLIDRLTKVIADSRHITHPVRD